LPSLLPEHFGPERRQKGLPVYPTSIVWKSLDLSRRIYVQFRTGACSIGGDYYYQRLFEFYLKKSSGLGNPPNGLARTRLGLNDFTIP
jgi:hypothetical protein